MKTGLAKKSLREWFQKISQIIFLKIFYLRLTDEYLFPFVLKQSVFLLAVIY